VGPETPIIVNNSGLPGNPLSSPKELNFSPNPPNSKKREESFVPPQQFPKFLKHNNLFGPIPSLEKNPENNPQFLGIKIPKSPLTFP